MAVSNNRPSASLLLVIDEIRRAPELVLPIKARVDIDSDQVQFLLTGSAACSG